MWYTLIIFELFLSAINGQDLIVDLPEGTIAGKTLTSFLGNTYYAFQEIPYAAPPVGDLRFVEPRDVEPWNGVLNTTRNTKQCFQPNNSEDNTLLKTEDCLYLNVYTPQEPSVAHDLPVLVFIHGGAFIEGTGAISIYNPGRLIDYDIIVVTINYRLGPFGFLTSMDGAIPGNLGLKDQRFALKWIKSHISLFGGDPEKITISGESAGSISVGYLLVGQNTQGLFRGAIQESGSSLAAGTFTNDARTAAFNSGKTLDPSFNSEDSADLLTLLKSASAEDIMSACFQVTSEWYPVLEENNVNDPIITAPMHESFMNGSFNQVPVLIGFNSEEFLFFMKSFNIDPASYDEDPSLLIDKKLNVPEENRRSVGEELKKLYTNSTFSEDLAGFVKFFSDFMFPRNIIRQAEVSSIYASVYLYQFSFMGKVYEFHFNRTVVPGAEGVEHTEELFYLWDRSLPDNINGDDWITMQRLLKLWTNFVKYVNPTPNEEPLFDSVIWPVVQSGTDIVYLNINETLEIQSNPRHYKEISTLLLQHIQPPYIVF